MKNDDLEITQNKENGVLRFILKGRVSVINAPTLQFKLEEVLKHGEKNIVLNMMQVTFLSSAGIRIILKIHKKTFEMKGSLGIEEPSEVVKNVLGMTALEELLV